MSWIDMHNRQLADLGGLVRTEQATCYTGKCYFASEYIYVSGSIENELRQFGAKPAKIDSAREKGIPIIAVADLLEVLER